MKWEKWTNKKMGRKADRAQTRLRWIDLPHSVTVMLSVSSEKWLCCLFSDLVEDRQESQYWIETLTAPLCCAMQNFVNSIIYEKLFLRHLSQSDACAFTLALACSKNWLGLLRLWNWLSSNTGHSDSDENELPKEMLQCISSSSVKYLLTNFIKIIE